MAGTRIGKRPWIPFLLGLVIAGLAIWLVVDTKRGAPWRESGTESVAIRPPSTAGDGSGKSGQAPTHQIAAGGRLVIDEKDLPIEGPLALALELSDEARGGGPRAARIISASSGRLDAQATPLPGSDSGMRLDVDRAFLARGLYLIEVETVDHHPLQLRRYVLEIQ